MTTIREKIKNACKAVEDFYTGMFYCETPDTKLSDLEQAAFDLWQNTPKEWTDDNFFAAPDGAYLIFLGAVWSTSFSDREMVKEKLKIAPDIRKAWGPVHLPEGFNAIDSREKEENWEAIMKIAKMEP